MSRAHALGLALVAALSVQSTRLCAEPVPAGDPDAGPSRRASPDDHVAGPAELTAAPQVRAAAEAPSVPFVYGSAVGTTTYGPPVRPTPEARRAAWNAVYVELGGPGVFYSINYERVFDERWSLRLGVGTMEPLLPIVTIPILVNASFGSMDHKLELGAGVTILDFYRYSGLASAGTGALVVAGVGYRYVPGDGGVFFRVGVNAIALPGASLLVLPSAGLGIGVILLVSSPPASGPWRDHRDRA